MPAHPIRRCLIANRGEIAVRVIRACRELGIETVAVYSQVDARAHHAQLADFAYEIGPPAPTESYLRGEVLLDVARRAGCDAVHPGYGFLSESAGFAQAVIDAGLVWVGPPPRAIALMGVKTEARALMQAAGVPVVPGFQSDSADDAAFARAAGAIGYPIMVKAAGGGGGKGIRIVYEAADLPDALASARNEAQKAFGDPRIFLEKYIEAGHHVEIQVLADAHGHVVHLFERECSAQRRHQKIIEESPSPFITPSIRAQMGSAAVAAASAVGYVNAGTVEFIVGEDGAYYFLEMNTRLQVEHPVTELVTGHDLVQLQLAIAGGAVLPFTQADLAQRGHAIECRLYAEDPRNNFLPAIGPILDFQAPQGPGVRVDAGVRSGDEVSIYYDPMIAKIIVYAPTREAAIARMRRALDDTVVLGTTTNRDFLRALLDHPAFRSGRIHTRWIDEHLDELLPSPPPLSPLALVAAALHDQTPSVPAATGGPSDGDAYSPWRRNDHFRIGAS